MRATALHKISFLLITFFYLSQPVFADDWNKLSPYLPHDGVIQGDVLKRVPSEKIKAIESKLFKRGFKFEVQQLMVFWCSVFSPRRILHTGI